jgi:hypothetical protein
VTVKKKRAVVTIAVYDLMANMGYDWVLFGSEVNVQ